MASWLRVWSLEPGCLVGISDQNSSVLRLWASHLIPTGMLPQVKYGDKESIYILAYSLAHGKQSIHGYYNR